MIETDPLDTPINRVTIAQLPIDRLQAFIGRLRERRLQAYNIYLAGVEAKQRKSRDSAAVGLDKRLDQMSKLILTTEKNIEKLEKYALEVQGLRLVLGDNINADT